MKISVLLFFIGMTTVFAIPGFSQPEKVSLQMNDVTLRDVFHEIEKQSDYSFFYNDQFSDLNKMVAVNESESSIKEVLDGLLNSTDLSYKLLDHNLIVITPKQDKLIIKGKVTDSEGKPLQGVTIIVKGTINGTSTNSSGNYEIEAKPGDEVLEFSFLGMESQEIEINGRAVINVTLLESTSLIDDVVIIGYGSVEKKDLTGSVATVKAEEIMEIKTQTIDQALVGQMTGVFVTASGGGPGTGAIVHIRGLSSLTGDNQPLYVVDGVPIIQNPNFGTLGLGTYGSRSNPILSVNPNDIERVDVLKDASAAAIYGSRAANGVILITTKRGTLNQVPKFNFSVNSTIQNPSNTYDYLSADEWIPLVKGVAQATLDQYPEIYWPYFPAEYAIVYDPDYFGNANTDWQKEIVNKNALWNEYNLNATGGSGNANYYVSATASNQEGVFIGSQFDRYSLSSSLDAIVTPGFKVGTSINYNYSVNRSSGIYSLQQGSFRPDLPVYDEDGNFTGTEISYGFILNPVGGDARSTNKTTANNLYGSIYGELELIKGLKFRSRLNTGLNDSKVESFSPSFSAEALFYGAYYSEPGARLSNQTNAGYTLGFENTLNYGNTFNGIHKLDAMVGISWDRSRLDLESQTYLGFPDDVYLTNIQSANRLVDWGSEAIENGLNSYFSRVNYVYDERFLVTFTARYDGSTKFGPDSKWGFFPSGAIAWNMHNERFLKGNPIINQLKLRASMGRTGQDNLPSFTYLAYYQSLDNGDSFYNGVNGIAVPGVPNTDIKWETTDQLDLGVEFGLFNYRLTGEIVYFEKKTSDIILLVPIPAETGSSSWRANVADVSNTGWEITLGGDILHAKDFRWNSSFNISFVQNNVDALKGGATSSNGSAGIMEGYPIGVILGYDVIKIAQTQDEIDALNDQAGGAYQSTLLEPGDYIFRDVSGPAGEPDGKITTLDRTVLGDINPDYFGGWNNKLTYKNIDLSFNWQFVMGSERAYTAISDLYYFSAESNSLSIVRETWREDYTDAPYARLMSGTHGYTPTSKSVVDASYLRLRSASFGYNLPEGLLNRLSIAGARFSLTCNNLITITKYPGLDPESVNTQRGGSTIDMTSDGGYAYPNTRTFTLGLKVTL